MHEQSTAVPALPSLAAHRIAEGWRALGDGPGVPGMACADHWRLPDAPPERTDANGYGWRGRARVRTWDGTARLEWSRFGLRMDSVGAPVVMSRTIARLYALQVAARRRVALLERLADDLIVSAIRSEVLRDLDVEQRHAELVRLELHAARHAERRRRLDPDRLAERRRIERERQRAKRAAETPEQRAARRKANAECQRARRARHRPAVA